MVDILIIGAGGAGLMSAVTAKERGLNVLLVSKHSPTSSQTVMAQGGINAPLGNLESDSKESHIEDTIKASSNLADRYMVKKLVDNSVDTISYLEREGVPFSRIDDASTPLASIAQRKLGGASSKRACYAQDYTGLKILHTLYDRALMLGVEIREHLFLLELIRENQRVVGAIFLDKRDGVVKEIKAKSVILATGGYGSLYRKHTTNANSATGDGVAVALRAGARVANMEFVQFHPTALKGSSILISESARGEGGYLIDSKGERFIDELAPRDVVVKAVFEKIKSGESVYLDIRHLGEEKITHLMPQELHLCRLYAGIDPITEPIPISPALHYTIGGVDIDREFKAVGLDGLYCVGEVSCSYVHGANRLGGNSLLEIFTFGRLVVDKVETFLKQDNLKATNSYQYIEKNQKRIDSTLNRDSKISIYNLRDRLSKVMFESFGVLRVEDDMKRALDEIREIELEFESIGVKDKSREFNQELIDILEFENSLLLAKALAKSAIFRRESRGVHLRDDFPDKSKEFECSSIYFEDRVIRRENEL